MSNLTPTIKSIQDVMRQDSGVDGDGDRCLGRSNNVEQGA